jgi:hypothetical protein
LKRPSKCMMVSKAKEPQISTAIENPKFVKGKKVKRGSH